jgi:dTDP-glucose 4,6-dehydratase
VLGDITKLESVVAQFNVELLVVAIAAIDSISLGNLENRCRDLGIKIRVIPSSLQLLTGNVTIDQIQDISPENFLGRRVVRQDNSSLFEFVQGKRVLITGAGGSIGSELAKQIHGLNPEKLCLVDRDETALLNLQLRVDGIGNLTDESLVLADIRDLQRMNEIFLAFKPHIVLHAAALKHLTTLERFPNEAYKTNVLGTQNILKIALNVNVETFINISTDKAADPTSALGRSKLSTERMIASIPNINGKYISVRFGNVIGSQGSFLHTFKFQIRNGGPVTITHPDVSRFFMTISEASNLVLHAGVIGLHGQTLVLEMGNPVKIEEVARRMIRDSGKKIEIKYSGLREGEKLSEVLIAPTEKVSQTSNPSIYATKVEGWPDWSNLEFNQVFPLEMPSGN